MSWKKPTLTLSSHTSDILLNHEQGHFNIAELKVRIVKDSLKKLWLKNNINIDSILSFYPKLKESGDLYDSFTKHGLDTIKQKKFDSIMNLELSKY